MQYRSAGRLHVVRGRVVVLALVVGDGVGARGTFVGLAALAFGRACHGVARRDLLTGLLERGNLGNLSSGAGVVVGLGTGLGLGWCHVVAVPTGAPFSGVGSVRVGCVCCACRVTMKLALLGDSIAWGQGAAREQERLAPRLEAGLAVHGFDTVAKVFAQPGARSSSLPPQVAAAVRWAPGLAVIVIGANDLTHFEAARPAVQALADAVRELRAAGARSWWRQHQT